MTASTQVTHPWRAVARTVFQGLVAAAAFAAPIYSAVTNKDPALAGGLAGAMLLTAGAITKVMAMPAVEAFIAKFLPFLATQPAVTAPLPTPTLGTVGNVNVKISTPDAPKSTTS